MNLRQSLKKKLSKKELSLLKRAFDIVGDIAILEIKSGLGKKQKIIANEILKIHKNVKTVCKKAGPTYGIKRIRPVKVIAGQKKTKTTHKENKCLFELDLNKVFFTPRLGSERLRIINKVKKNEIILDLFAGVGPFSIEIAKLTKAEKVYAVDINQDAYNFLKENIILNKVSDKVAPFLGDARKIINKNKLKGDRIIMNLPMYSEDFLDVGFKSCKKNGIIHFYAFSEEKNLYEDTVKLIKERAKKYKKKVRILKKIKCGQISPRKWRICIDIKVK